MSAETVPSFFEVAQPNLCRPPDWRWHRACGIQNSTHPPASRIGDQGPGFGWIRRTVAFLHDLSRCQTTAQLGWLSGQHRSFFWAHRLYGQSTCRRTKALLEAYLLTGATNEEIARRFNVPADVVETYHNVFFEVRDQLENTQYIQASVIARASAFYSCGDANEKLWKTIGYHHGIKVLDAATTGALEPGSRRSTSIHEFIHDQVIGLAQLHAAITAVAAADHPEAQAALVKVYPLMAELEQHRSALANTDSQLLTHIQAMIDSIPITVASHGEKWDENDPLTKYDRGAVELSLEELMAVQQGGKPHYGDWFNESAYERAAEELRARSASPT
jgi:hypothetical protein